tara:strand:- start:63588 stop:63839 length:252 start_codon:yes stop_codon:yes gene_type:complete
LKNTKFVLLYQKKSNKKRKNKETAKRRFLLNTLINIIKIFFILGAGCKSKDQNLNPSKHFLNNTAACDAMRHNLSFILYFMQK